ncbi:carbohydrate-binding module family 5 protein [Macrolepiota fuliginosa MF-IS2]|uniref:chitinase n=1 Tax=Macrolepiota fuliginosa MF-IS2 TaxID=1400762 RepID=A0A9P6C291_9AGAR|nr:carbohydrate-binding module family 5 protein [Macrolepiota fuliginosa MF-IS2]
MVALRNYLALSSSLLFASGILQALAFDNSRNDNVAVYWGQNSYGATHTSDTANWQKTLSAYCQDDAIDAIPIAFLNVFFSVGGDPEVNMANICSSNSGVFSGTNLANCQFLAADIQACQARGKIVTLSLGGASGAATFSSDAQAQTFADTIWNLFLGGSSSTRPFGSAVLDGVDLDIEGGGSTGFAAFVTRIRSHASGASKQYYVTAAPQCPFPDAFLGPVLNAVSFDAVYVQFYNNFCGLTNFNNPNAWNFATWDNWAKTQSPNRNVKIYIGAPASSTAAGSGFVDINTLSSIALQTRSQFSSFGGVMLWDASQAVANNRYDLAIKNALSNGGGSGGTITQPPASTSTAGSPSTSTPASGSCAGVAAWSSSVAYPGGSQVTFNGHLWTAKWWSQADAPGGAAQDWADNGACTARLASAAVSHSNSVSVKASSVKITSVSQAATKAPAASSSVRLTSAESTIATKLPSPKESTPIEGAAKNATATSSSESKEPSARKSSRFFRF